MPLCQSCHNFDLYSFSKDRDGSRGYRLRTIEYTAGSGCAFCLLLYQTYSELGSYDYDDRWLHFSISENYANPANILGGNGLQINRLRVQVDQRNILRVETGPDKAAELCVAADPGSAAAENGDVIGRYLGENLDSDHHYFTIKRWVDNCLEHEKCTETVSGTTKFNPREVPLPSRCIEIGRKSLFLRDTDGESGAYIALTHRWNEETEICKTTVENYDNRRNGKAFPFLPKAFEDVIKIAQKLDIRYVWIDSLCIIQSGDDSRDWKKEAVKMAQYYQYAVLVVAGTAVSRETGILSPRTQSKPQHLVKLPYRDKSGVRKGHFYIYKREQPPHLDYWMGVRNTEITRRGWTFQEWMLARRIIYYTPFGVFFECQTDHPKNSDGEVIYPERTSDFQDLGLDLKMSFHFTNSSGLDFWYKIVEAYAGMQLTKPDDDRILAISGVAKEFQEMQLACTNEMGRRSFASSPEYLSGLWLSDIHYGLLWEEKMPHKAFKTVSAAPSWSWASAMTNIQWPKRKDQTLVACKIVGITSKGVEYPIDKLPGRESRGSNFEDHNDEAPDSIASPFNVGNISTGLLVKARLQTVLVRGRLETGGQREDVGYATACEVNDGSKNWRSVCSPSAPELIGGWGSFESIHIQGQLDSHHGIVVYALHVASETGVGASGIGLGFLSLRGDVFSVLYLENVGGRCFRRIGVGRVFEKDLISQFLASNHQVIELV